MEAEWTAREVDGTLESQWSLELDARMADTAGGDGGREECEPSRGGSWDKHDSGQSWLSRVCRARVG